jgi:hypothetical protein
MKRTIFFLLMLLSLVSHAQVWQEQFNGLTDGLTTDAGTTAWTTIQPTGGPSSFSKQTPAAGYELFVMNDTGNEGTWESAVVNISAYTEIAIELTLYSYYTYSSDYIKCYYKINGGAEIQFGELYGSDGLNITSAASAIVSGNTLQIIVKGSDNTPGTTGNVINGMAFDDVTMTSITILYSRTSGNWNNTSSWSTSGFSGTSCSCTPNTNSRVIIGNNNTISIPSAATTAGVSIQTSGRLQFTGNTSLTMARGGTISIDNGGVLNNNGGNGNIIYGAYTYNVIINGSIAITTFTANVGSSINFSGTGNASATNFYVNSGSGRTITLNISGGLTVSNDLYFQTSANTSVINQQTLNVGTRIIFTSDNVSFTNNSSITAGSIVVNANTSDGNVITNNASATLNVGGINLNSGNFTLNNYGTINQTGSFSNVDSGSAFRNQDGGTWNFGGGGTNTRLYCNYGINTFNYNALGAQTILAPADNYSNLTLSGSGLKTAAANLDVNGDLNISGTAQLDASASSYAISLAGNWNVSSTNANPFVERTGTVTFDGSTSQTIYAASGTETFYNLAINKATTNAMLSSTDLSVSNNLNLTNGGLSINGRILSITKSTTNAITRTNGCVISETTTLPYSQLRWSIGTSTGSFVFPFGKTNNAADYIPFTFNITTAGSPAAGTVSLLTYATSTNNLPWPDGVSNFDSSPGVDNSANSPDRFWYITLDGYSTNPYSSVTFVATPSEVGTTTNLRAQRWNSLTSRWDSPKSGQSNPNNYSATVPGVNTFSPWVLTAEEAPLPIKLLSFNAFLKNDIVNLEWETAQEYNNEYFTILKSIDEETFQELIRTKGAGTSNEKHSYHAQDLLPHDGQSYYRLKQTDRDGRETYYNSVMIEYHQKEKSLRAYPIPCNGTELTVAISGLKPNENIILEIRNMSGQKIFNKTITLDTQGKFTEKLIFGNTLAPGIYCLKANKYLKLVVE